jgi:hypothetical protein
MSIVCLSLASLPNSVRCVLFLYLVEGADPAADAELPTRRGMAYWLARVARMSAPHII